MTVRELAEALRQLPAEAQDLPVGWPNPAWDRQGKLTNYEFEEVNEVVYYSGKGEPVRVMIWTTAAHDQRHFVVLT